MREDDEKLAGTPVQEKPMTQMNPQVAALLAQPSFPGCPDDPIVAAMKRLFLRVQLCACHNPGSDPNPLSGSSCQTCQLDLASLQDAVDFRGEKRAG